MGLAVYYVGVIAPALNSPVVSEDRIRLLRHSYLAPMGAAFGVLLLTSPAPLRRLDKRFRDWLVAIMAASTFMLVHGIVRGAELGAIILDAGNYITFVVAVLLGARHESWPYLDKFLRISLYVAAALMFADLLQFETASRRETTDSVAYRIQNAAFALPYVFFTVDSRRRGEKALIAIVFLTMVLANLMFQKRAPTVRLLMMLILLTFAVRGSSRVLATRWRKFIGVLSLLVAAALGLYLAAKDDDEQLVAESSRLLSERFQAPGGVGELLVTENDRVTEAGWLLEDLAGGSEMLFGKGFGGSFVAPSWTRISVREEAGVRAPRIYLAHIGLLAPLLKGGLVFSVLFFGGWIASIFAARKLPVREPITVAAQLVLLLTLLFMATETLWGPGNILAVALAGICIGRCAERCSSVLQRAERSAGAEV